jgi:hypothetical protein
VTLVGLNRLAANPDCACESADARCVLNREYPLRRSSSAPPKPAIPALVTIASTVRPVTAPPRNPDWHRAEVCTLVLSHAQRSLAATAAAPETPDGAVALPSMIDGPPLRDPGGEECGPH